MATYAIGDVQGCYDALCTLLDRIGFDPAADSLWFAGDLVNRGPQSLATLRLVRALGAGAITVLGNHDLHLIAVAHGNLRHHRKDTFHDVLNAPDRDELIDWLCHQCLLHHDAGLGYTLIHAGLPPQWDLATAQRCAREVEIRLRGADRGAFMAHLYGDTPDIWDEALDGFQRARFIVNCLTRLRYCAPDGRLALAYKGPPGSQPKPYLPWFALPQRASLGLTLLFGHWSTLGAYDAPGVHALDTACLWGGKLTAYCLTEPARRIEIPCGMASLPGGD